MKNVTMALLALNNVALAVALLVTRLEAQDLQAAIIRVENTITYLGRAGNNLSAVVEQNSYYIRLIIDFLDG